MSSTSPQGYSASISYFITTNWARRFDSDTPIPFYITEPFHMPLKYSVRFQMGRYQYKARAIFCVTAICLLSNLALTGCSSAPAIKTVHPSATSITDNTPITATSTVAQTPTLPPLTADPGWQKVFQQNGSQAQNGVTTRSTIGEFTSAKSLNIWITCLGTGSVEMALGQNGPDITATCTGNTPITDKDSYSASATAPATHYIVTASITDAVQWEVLIEVQN